MFPGYRFLQMRKINFGGYQWRPTSQIELVNSFYLVLTASGTLFFTELVAHIEASGGFRGVCIPGFPHEVNSRQPWVCTCALQQSTGAQSGSPHRPGMCLPVPCNPPPDCSAHSPTCLGLGTLEFTTSGADDPICTRPGEL